MADVVVGAWKMSLLQDHENVTVNVVATTVVCWIRECKVEESELLLNESWKRGSMKVEL
jgi:hypothetical protein